MLLEQPLFYFPRNTFGIVIIRQELSVRKGTRNTPARDLSVA